MRSITESFVVGLVAGGSYGLADEWTNTSLQFWPTFLIIMFIGFIAVKRLGLSK